MRSHQLAILTLLVASSKLKVWMQPLKNSTRRSMDTISPSEKFSSQLHQSQSPHKYLHTTELETKKTHSVIFTSSCQKSQRATSSRVLITTKRSSDSQLVSIRASQKMLTAASSFPSTWLMTASRSMNQPRRTQVSSRASSFTATGTRTSITITPGSLQVTWQSVET